MKSSFGWSQKENKERKSFNLFSMLEITFNLWKTLLKVFPKFTWRWSCQSQSGVTSILKIQLQPTSTYFLLNIHIATLPAYYPTAGLAPHIWHHLTPQYVSLQDVDYQFSSHSLKIHTVRCEIYIDNCVSTYIYTTILLIYIM